MNCSLCGSTNTDEAVACAACGAALSPVAEFSGDALSAGTTLQNGAFRIDAVLGQGGFGITYRGFDLLLQRPVAVKEFFPFGCRRFPNFDVQPSQSLSLSSYGTFKSRFVEEARVLARFKHPAIVDVYSVWEENNAAYMVMELLEGQTLEQVLQARNKPLEESEVLGLAQRVGEALGEVHRRGLLHRDIKPANIVQCDDGRVMLIDFGTAREYSKDAQTMQGHSIVVTPGYAPLEQYAERATRGAYTDVYSLAATIYHLLTGEMPPAASDRALGVDLRPAHELNPKVSPTVSAALSCAMETQVARRPQSVDEFLQMLHGQRAAALAPQSSTGLARATGKALDFSQEEKPSDKNDNFRQRYEQAVLEAREEWATLSRADVIEARKQLLNSLPLSPDAPSIGTSPKDAFAALVASQGASNSSLQQTSASGQSLLAPPQPADDSGVKMRKIPSPLRSAAIALGIFGVICIIALLDIVGGTEKPADSGQFTTPIYNSQPMLSREELARNLNLGEPQKPIAIKQLPNIKLGDYMPMITGNRLAVSDRTFIDDSHKRTPIYDFPSLRPLCVLPEDLVEISLKFSNDGSLMVTQSAKNINLWDSRTGKLKFAWPIQQAEKWSHTGREWGADISPNGKFVVGSTTPSTFTAWSTETGRKILQIPRSPSSISISSGTFTHDSTHLVIVDARGDDEIEIRVQWRQLQTGKVTATKTFRVPRNSFGYNYPRNLQRLADHRLVVTMGAMLPALVNLKSSNAPVQILSSLAPSGWPQDRAFEHDILPLIWSSDARFILCSVAFGAKAPTIVRRFDPKTMQSLGTAVLSIPVQGNTVNGAFSIDNKLVYVVTNSGELLTWRLDQLKWSK